MFHKSVMGRGVSQDVTLSDYIARKQEKPKMTFDEWYVTIRPKNKGMPWDDWFVCMREAWRAGQENAK